MAEQPEAKKAESSPSASSDGLFTTFYDITRAIFRHLPIRSVETCSLVCQSWAHMARLTKQSRRTIHALTYPTDNTSPLLLQDFDAWISSYIHDKLWSIPSLAFIVTTNTLDEQGFLSSPGSPPKKSCRRSCTTTAVARSRRLDSAEALMRHVNTSCAVLMVASEGIVTSDDGTQSKEIESGDALGILIFPKCPADVFDIYPFELPRQTRIADMSRSQLHQVLGGVPEDLPIRGMIFFFRQRQRQINDCLKKLQELYSPNIAIMGGFIDGIRSTSNRKSPSFTCGLALTGDRTRVQIRQVVLEPDVRTREAVRAKLKQLKSSHNENCSLSFAFQVSCVARGSEFYNDEVNVECSEFRNLFPQTPLIGIFGNGELGHDYLPDGGSSVANEESRTTQTEKELFLTYSSVFSLVSIRL